MSNEQIAHNVGPSRVDIAYQRHGDPRHPTLLLVMGLAGQMVHWPLGLVDAFTRRKLHVVRFDNRDAGRSTHFNAAPRADLPAVRAGDLSTVSYRLTDFAADTVGLLDALDIRAAHLLGASLGGAIAQTMAIEHPARVLSLTSIMSSSGDPRVGQAHAEVMAPVFGVPPVHTREEVMARAVRISGIIGSPGFPADPGDVAARAGLAFDRDHDPSAIQRQAAALVASGERTAQLAKLDLPTLVVHGLADKLCDPSGGRATAEAISGAELMLIEGMGHDLPRALWEQLADRVAAVVERGEARRRR
jgi:pimeloyl-ACP methyl ester carboxylesterase